MAANQRKTVVINPQFQIRLGIYLLIIVLLSSIIYPFTIYNILVDVIENVKPFIPSVAEDFETKKITLIGILALWHLGSSAIIFVLCIFITHRIAGPLFKLTNYLKNLDSMPEIKPLHFRKGDYFQEIPEALNSLVARVQAKSFPQKVSLQEINQTLAELSTTISEDKRPILQEICRKLDSLQN
ncbi:MAG: hypothetical protein J6Y94_02335 [Bacteriovoracaceae bacterium]|nr:hypothetical protein [Bacteriovoracaceae bacterium]